MEYSLSIIEKLNVEELLLTPHLSYVENSILERKKVSSLILQKKIDDIMLITSSGFLIDSVFAGLSEKHIEHIAKNAPKNYKESLLKIQEDPEMMQGVFEIAQAMDRDLGENVTQNQQRVKNVMRYIQDNQIAFQF
ncbi:MAG: hypothetical protein WC823_05630 [Parcubacteria group bacterium]|jgi:hypothetical protein